MRANYLECHVEKKNEEYEGEVKKIGEYNENRFFYSEPRHWEQNSEYPRTFSDDIIYPRLNNK